VQCVIDHLKTQFSEHLRRKTPQHHPQQARIIRRLV
jgi:hypothetical protein